MSEQKGGWGDFDRNSSGNSKFLSNADATYQFKVKAAIDSAAIPGYLERFPTHEPRVLRFYSEVISEGEENGKLIGHQYKIKLDNPNSIGAVLRHMETIFNVKLAGGDPNLPLDMGPFIGRVFMAKPKEITVGDSDNPSKRVVLNWFEQDKDFGGFVYDEAIIAQNESAIIEPGSNDTSEAFWAAVVEADERRANRDSGDGGGAPSDGDDDEPLPF